MEAISGDVSVDTVAVRNHHMQRANESADEGSSLFMNCSPA
jgi:hypothetical protein